jgi:hypothetical protein
MTGDAARDGVRLWRIDVLGSADTRRLADLLAEHMAWADDQIERLEKLRDRLPTAHRQVDDEPGAEGLPATIEAMNRGRPPVGAVGRPRLAHTARSWQQGDVEPAVAVECPALLG